LRDGEIPAENRGYFRVNARVTCGAMSAGRRTGGISPWRTCKTCVRVSADRLDSVKREESS